MASPAEKTDDLKSWGLGEPPQARPRTRPSRDEIAEVARLRGTVAIGLVLAVLFFLGFGSWAFMAPLKSAALGQATVKVNGSRKQVQHLEGGILKEMLVKDGDQVAANQVVIRLDATRAAAELALFEGKLKATLALDARLVAEQQSLNEIAFPQSLQDATDGDSLEFMQAQRTVFRTRREAQTSQIALRDQRVAQLGEEINGYRAEITSQAKQLVLTKQELADSATLMEKGLQRKSRHFQIERAVTQTEGLIARNEALIAQATQKIAEARQEQVLLRQQSFDEVANERKAVTEQVFTLQQQLIAARDKLQRLEVRAPVAGIVVNAKVVAPGSVLGAGEPLMDIVPSDTPLVIETRVALNDVEAVQVGASARIRLTAFNARRTPVIEGKVTQMSADSIEDRRTGQSHYVAIVTPSPAQLASYRMLLQPGMPAEVYIETGERTVADYLLAPLIVASDRGLRER